MSFRGQNKNEPYFHLLGRHRMRTAFIAFICCVALLRVGCNQTEANTTSGLTDAEKKLLDNQIAMINLLPSSVKEGCESAERLSRIADLAETGAGRDYAARIVATHRTRIYDELNRILVERLNNSVTEEMLRRNYTEIVIKKYGSNCEVVAMQPLSRDIVSRQVPVRLEVTHSISLRKHTGLFQKDEFAVIQAKQTIIAEPNCQGRPPEDVVLKYAAEFME